MVNIHRLDPKVGFGPSVVSIKRGMMGLRKTKGVKKTRYYLFRRPSTWFLYEEDGGWGGGS